MAKENELTQRENFLALAYSQVLFDLIDSEQTMVTPDLKGLVAVAFLHQIEQISKDGELEDAKVLKHNYLKYCQTQFGIEGDEADVDRQIQLGMGAVNELINYFTNTDNGLLRDYRGSIDALDEIKVNNDPGELWSIILNPNKKQRRRFEALRKIQLLEGYLAYHQTSEKANENAKYFSDALQGWWFEGEKILHDNYFSVSHSTTDYSVVDLAMLTQEQLVKIGPFDKVYKLSMRQIKSNELLINVMSDYREKSPAAAIIKQIRKDTLSSSHPDDVGSRFVVEKSEDIQPLIQSLLAYLRDQGHSVSMHSIKSTIDGSQYSGRDKASSKKLKVVQFGLNLDGRQYEIMIHTIESYTNEMYQDGVGHEEYAISRLFDNGVIKLLFPPEIYGTLHLDSKEILIAKIRDNKIQKFDPLIEEVTGMRIVRYPLSNFGRDIEKIVTQIKESKSNIRYITPVDDSALVFATTLARELQLKIKFLPRRRIRNSENYLLAENVARTGDSIKIAKEKLPKALTACLINSGYRETPVDFAAVEEKVGKNNWYLFHFDPTGYATARWKP